MAIIIAVFIVAIAVAYMAWTGEGAGMNPITIDNVDSLLRSDKP